MKRTKDERGYKVVEGEIPAKPEKAIDIDGSKGPITVSSILWYYKFLPNTMQIKGWFDNQTFDASLDITIHDKSIGRIKRNMGGSMYINVDFEDDKGSVGISPYPKGLNVYYDLHNLSSRSSSSDNFTVGDL